MPNYIPIIFVSVFTQPGYGVIMMELFIFPCIALSVTISLQLLAVLCALIAFNSLSNQLATLNSLSNQLATLSSLSSQIAFTSIAFFIPAVYAVDCYSMHLLDVQ